MQLKLLRNLHLRLTNVTEEIVSDVLDRLRHDIQIVGVKHSFVAVEVETVSWSNKTVQTTAQPELDTAGQISSPPPSSYVTLMGDDIEAANLVLR